LIAVATAISGGISHHVMHGVGPPREAEAKPAVGRRSLHGGCIDPV
jgi:hypothetical protein